MFSLHHENKDKTFTFYIRNSIKESKGKYSVLSKNFYKFIVLEEVFFL